VLAAHPPQANVRAGWDWLQQQKGFAPEQVVIAGDSAGGHLAVDLTFGLALAREELRPDPAIRVRDAKRLVGLYWAGTDVTHPRLTLDVTGGRAMPPTLIQAGGAEMLVADPRHLAADITAAGGDCELQIWPDPVHVFQALPRLTPEAAPAMRNIASFISAALHDNQIDRAAG
jgi:acetyl esterase/lipase